MFHVLRKLFGRRSQQTAGPHSRRAEARSAAPAANVVASNPEIPSDASTHLRYEAVIDRMEQIAGYEFSLREEMDSRLQRRGGMAKRAYDNILVSRLAGTSASSLLGRRLGFLSLGIDSLDHPALDRLPAGNTVLIIDVPEGDAGRRLPALRLAEFRTRGYKLGLAVHAISDVDPMLLDLCDYLAVDAMEFDALDLQSLIRTHKRAREDKRPAPQFFACNLRSDDDFQFCFRAGFDLFHGVFISNAESLPPAAGGINRMTVLPILSMVRNDQSFTLIARQIRNDPVLTFKLLRYLTSAAIGLRSPIEGVVQGLVLLGREQFYRWLSLLLFDFSKPGYRQRAMAERALVRGRTLELLSGRGCIPRAADHLFLVGLFSLLDLSMDRPLAELVAEAALPTTVRAALLGNPGPLRDALELVALGDDVMNSPPDKLAVALARCGIDDDAFSRAAGEALIWADQVLSIQVD